MGSNIWIVEDGFLFGGALNVQLHQSVAGRCTQEDRTIVKRRGVNYSEALNEMWHLVGEQPMYDDQRAGPQWDMTVTWNTKYGDYYATGKGHNKKAARREAAGELLCKLGLIDKVEPKMSHLKGAAQRQRYWENPRPASKPVPRWRQMAS